MTNNMMDGDILCLGTEEVVGYIKFSYRNLMDRNMRHDAFQQPYKLVHACSTSFNYLTPCSRAVRKMILSQLVKQFHKVHDLCHKVPPVDPTLS